MAWGPFHVREDEHYPFLSCAYIALPVTDWQQAVLK